MKEAIALKCGNCGTLTYVDAPKEERTLRDYFAAAALQGLVSTGDADAYCNPYITAAEAYKLADAMMAEREKGAK